MQHTCRHAILDLQAREISDYSLLFPLSFASIFGLFLKPPQLKSDIGISPDLEMSAFDENSASSDDVSSKVVASALANEFGSLFNRLRCNDKTVREWINALATEHYDPLAQAVVAIGYSQGFFSKDIEKALFFAEQCLSWLRSQSDKNSWFCLGKFYELGILVDVDETEAELYFKLAAEAGSELAQTSLGVCFFNKENFAEEVECYRVAAHAGYSVAQHNLGLMYLEGRGVTLDYQQVIKWFRLAAEQGYADSQNDLGISYCIGEGVDIDFVEAVHWFQLAAEQGIISAQYALGLRYHYGEGVAMDLEEAVRWFRSAAIEGNHADAQNWMGHCYENGYGVEANEVEMIRWYRLAEGQGHQCAQFNLGLCCEFGKGVTMDINEAIRLFTLASEQGHVDAMDRLAQLQE